MMEMAWKPRLEFAGAIYHVLSRATMRPTSPEHVEYRTDPLDPYDKS